MTNREALLSLAERASKMGAKIERVIENRGMPLSAGGQATAIAMIVTLDLGLFDEVAASLRAIGGGL